MQSNNYLVYTNFLNENEKEIALSILNKLNIKYYIFSPLKDTSKVVIFLLPEYMLKENIEDIFNKYISVIKIVPKLKDKVTHREYMGSIYSIGLKDDMIGDIFVYNDQAYFFTFMQNVDYILNNLTSVGKSNIKIETLDIYSDEVQNIKIKYKNITVMIPSNRIDAILSEVYLISRNKIKDKINNGDLYINSKEMFFAAYNVKEGDIVSFSKCGKFKIGKILGNTKTGKIILNIEKYS